MKNRRKPPKPRIQKKRRIKKPEKSIKNIFLENKKKFLFIILAILAICLIIYIFYRMFSVNRINYIFAKDAEKMQEDIENPIFKIDKIMIYSDANVSDLSEKSDLSNVNISQFTDFVVYINNKTTINELTEENTVNKIYVDNIRVSGAKLGEQKVYYKSIDDICKYRKILDSTNRIDYEVLHTNEEKEENILPNVFYTDCSEPFVISYVNENVVKNEDLSDTNEKVSLNGWVLKYLGISLNSLNYKISFTINIENNLGELFQNNCNLKINLNSDEGGIYTGYIMQIYDTSEENFAFRKVQT